MTRAQREPHVLKICSNEAQCAEEVSLDLTATTANLKDWGIGASPLSEKISFYWRVRVTDIEDERKTREMQLKLTAEPSALELPESRSVETHCSD